MESMIRESSPPEAHFATSTGSLPVDENLKVTASLPVADMSAGSRSTLNTEKGSSWKCSFSMIASDKAGAAFSRAACSESDFDWRSERTASISFSIAVFLSRRSDKPDIAPDNDFFNKSSSSTLLQECLCIRPYIKEIRSSTA